MGDAVGVRVQAKRREPAPAEELLDLAALRARIPDDQRPLPEFMTGATGEMAGVAAQVRMAARVDDPTLVYGETGTGKEVVARTIHDLSHRAHCPFHAVNCGALPESLIEAEPFGHTGGAFTGAGAAREGAFRAAAGGTLFLDEINAMPGHLQAKLLRALQGPAVRPLGSDREVATDVRIITSCRGLLKEALRDGTLRPDLFHRIRTIVIFLPPLRNRLGDLPLLLASFAERKNPMREGRLQAITREALDLLLSHQWPGNVRELETFVDRLIMNDRSLKVVAASDVRAHLDDPGPETIDPVPDERAETCPTLGQAVAAAERAALLRALREAAGNRERAAAILGIHRRSLQRYLRKHHLP